MDDRKKFQLTEVIIRVLDGTASQAQAEQLAEILSSDRDALDYYVGMIFTSSLIHEPSTVSVNDETTETDNCCTVNVGDESVDLSEDIETAVASSVWEALAEAGLLTEPVDVETEKPLSNPSQKYIKYRKPAKYQRKEVSKLSLYTAILSSAAMIILLLYVRFAPPPAVAVLTDSVNASWDIPGCKLKFGANLRPGPAKLLTGFAMLTFKSGAEVVIQAPAEFTLESKEQIYLRKGVVSVSVPKQAVGFTVCAPDVSIVDYGTEFGVSVGNCNLTEVHVFKGTVSVRDSSDPLIFNREMQLHTGQVSIADSSGISILEGVKSFESYFVRDLNHVRNPEKYFGRNLIINGNFEADSPSSSFSMTDYELLTNNISITGWNENTAATVVPYNCIGGRDITAQERASFVFPDSHGKYYYVGVEDNTVYQKINLSPIAQYIDYGSVRYNLSGWFGGWYDHTDNATLKVTFLNAFGDKLGSSEIGHVTVEERGGKVVFIQKSTAGNIPPETRSVLVELISHRGTGLADSYADNLSFVLSRK